MSTNPWQYWFLARNPAFKHFLPANSILLLLVGIYGLYFRFCSQPCGTTWRHERKSNEQIHSHDLLFQFSASLKKPNQKSCALSSYLIPSNKQFPFGILKIDTYSVQVFIQNWKFSLRKWINKKEVVDVKFNLIRLNVSHKAVFSYNKRTECRMFLKKLVSVLGQP